MAYAGMPNIVMPSWSQRDYNAARPVLFMHIPKTSGMALTHGLALALKAEHPVDGFDRSLFGHFEAYDELAPELRRRFFLSTLVMPEHPEVVCAHVAYSTLKERYSDPQCVTFLREPISRLLSHWLHWRGHSDALLLPWGPWGDRVREARGSLSDFLSSRRVACQTDNIALRMLLWPHPLIPNDDFIAGENDEILLLEAIERLCAFAYFDVIENADLSRQLGLWLRAEFQYKTINETRRLPANLCLNLHDALDPRATSLLEQRSRLDIELWKAVLRLRHCGRDIEKLRRTTLMSSIARHAWLLAMPLEPPQHSARSFIKKAARGFGRLAHLAKT